MIDRVIDALRPQVERLIVCGRAWSGVESIVDLRKGRIGPLAGLEAALMFARAAGLDAVLSVPVDTLPLPPNLHATLAGNGPAVLGRQYLIGYWPVACLRALGAFLDDGEQSVRVWAHWSGARFHHEEPGIVNVNRVSDLSAFEHT